MNRIRLLPTVVQNKIAAGEVVERPFAVVKELVENSLDSGANFISVELEEGGKKLIRVVDNGSGIAKEDLILAVTQHATSKISSAEELFSIITMGFRGEALASIASISQFVITSRQANADAFSLSVNGGVCGEVKPASCAEGTIVEARNLFFNTPVRLKFMKSDSSELAKINEIISCIALAYPQVGFQLMHNGRLIFQLPIDQEMEDRIQLLLPLNLTEELIEIPLFEGSFFRIHGYLGSPYLARPRRDYQYLFVNGRVVKDKLLQGVVSKLYEGLIPNGKYPVVILFLEIDPKEVDVNVHPTKFEVRFSQPNTIFSAILMAGKELLQPRAVASHQFTSTESNATMHHNSSTVSLSPLYNKLDNGTSLMAPTSTKTFSEIREENVADTLSILRKIYEPAENLVQKNQVAEERPVLDFRLKEEALQTDLSSSFDFIKESFVELQAEVIATIDKTFLIAVIENHVVMLDQHALHERMQFEKLKTSLTAGSIGSQRLLTPITLSFKEIDKQHLFENSKELERLGVLIEDFGPGLISVKGVPADVADLDIEAFLHEVLKDFELINRSDLENARHKMCATMACHSSVRARDALTNEDKKILVKYAWVNKELLTCPHGRPTIKIISPKELARIFHRL